MVLTSVAWFAVAVGLVVVEFATGGVLVFVWLAVAAAVAGVAMVLGVDAWWSLLLFAVVSVGLLGVVRPVARRHMRLRQGPGLRSGVDALVGVEAVVLEPVGRDSGLVKLGGESWSARLFEPHGDVSPVGSRVFVVEVVGATVTVIPTEPPPEASPHTGSPEIANLDGPVNDAPPTKEEGP